MKSDWFIPLIKQWDAHIKWSEEELKLLADELMTICELSGGNVYIDKNISQTLVRTYCVERVEAALNAHALTYARRLSGTKVEQMYAKETGASEVDLPFLTAMTYVPKVNINTATVEELEALPAIGRTTAQRIVTKRREQGFFSDIEAVKEVKGIGNQEFKEVALAISAERPPRDPAFNSPEIANFLKEPTFANYVAVLHTSNVSLSRYAPPIDEGVRGKITHEIRSLKNDLAKGGYNPYQPVPGILASQLKEHAQHKQKAAKILKLEVSEQMHGVLIDSAQYPFFMLELLKCAQSKIRIIMFFMRFEDEAKYPTDDLFAQLISAHKRGVDIKIILDRDAEGDAIQSRAINEEAYTYLRKNDIPVVYDSVERYTHTKLVAVDDCNVVVGSHNWTAGSFFAFDDMSIYINSSSLARHYFKQFEELWAEYNR